MGVFVHPLVLMNMCDQTVRSSMPTPAASAASSSSSSASCGLLFGVANGPKIEVFTSTDMQVDGGHAINKKFVELQTRLVTEAFPGYEILGWYACTAASEPEAVHVAIHKQLAHMTESPTSIFLHLNYSGVSHEQRDLPLTAYTLSYFGGAPHFDPVRCKMEATESESVVADAVSDMRAADASETPLVASLRASTTALRLLQERLGTIRGYLEAVKAGTVPPDRALLRQIAALCARIPVSDSEHMRTDMIKDLDDNLLVSMVGVMSRVAAAMGSFSDKYNVRLAAEREARVSDRGPGMTVGRRGHRGHYGAF